MRLDLHYGKTSLPLSLPDTLTVDVFDPRSVPGLTDPQAHLHTALDSPLGCLPLEGRAAPASIAIAVPDETRPFPIKLLLPALLGRIFAAWPNLSGKDVTLVVGGGLHPPADAAQLARILPSDLHGCQVVAHDAEHSPMAAFGTTSRGTPVEVNKAYGDAEFKIVMGMVDTHQFVGFTGGAKGVAIGCASAKMITANHSLMRQAQARAGAIEDNPVRLDLDEAGERIGVDIAINVVLNAAKEPVYIQAGVPALVLRKAAAVTTDLYALPFTKPYDIVIASCGGDPKDICLYQAQKGLNAAMQCAAEGGKILLLAECSQGIGDDVYHNYTRQFAGDLQLKTSFESAPFKMGAHKAYLFARATTRFTVGVHSALTQEMLKECHLQKVNMQEQVNAWIAAYKNPRIAVITKANSSFFVSSANSQ